MDLSAILEIFETIFNSGLIEKLIATAENALPSIANIFVTIIEAFVG